MLAGQVLEHPGVLVVIARVGGRLEAGIDAGAQQGKGSVVSLGEDGEAGFEQEGGGDADAFFGSGGRGRGGSLWR